MWGQFDNSFSWQNFFQERWSQEMRWLAEQEDRFRWHQSYRRKKHARHPQRRHHNLEFFIIARILELFSTYSVWFHFLSNKSPDWSHQGILLQHRIHHYCKKHIHNQSLVLPLLVEAHLRSLSRSKWCNYPEKYQLWYYDQRDPGLQWDNQPRNYQLVGEFRCIQQQPSSQLLRSRLLQFPKTKLILKEFLVKSKNELVNWIFFILSSPYLVEDISSWPIGLSIPSVQ